MLTTLALPDSKLELMLCVQPAEPLEWRAKLDGRCTDWSDVGSADQLVAIVQRITGEDDWFTVQTKNLHELPSGRYAQAANTGKGYLLEVAQVDGDITHNWRIGLGTASDAAGNRPRQGPKDSQVLSLAAVMEVLVSWLHGRGLPLGYGAALKVSRGA